jgi:hypothetical protein
MKLNRQRALKVFARFLVTGELTKVTDAWIVGLDLAWQLTIAACMQFVVALALIHLVDQAKEASEPPRSGRSSNSRRPSAA